MKILNELLNDINIIETHGNIDAGVSSVSLNSKTIEPHSLFVALSGNITDGHNFIEEVIEKGATTIVHEKDIKDFKGGVTYVKVADTHSAIGLIASNFYGEPSHKMKLVGVTGTSGKTTTATLLYQLFRDLGYKVGLISTNVNKINDYTEEAHRTTPDAVTLNELLARMVDDECSYCFMEVSSHSVSEKRISGLHFAGGVFTNLSLDHLDYHKTMDNYCDAKKGFFDVIPASGFAVANIDDERGYYMLSTTKAHTYTLSLKKPADFNERFESKLIGEFNAYNLLGIYAAAVLLLGYDNNVCADREKIINSIKKLEAVPGRFQYIKSKSGVTGIVDYAHKPDALENVLRTVNGMKGNGRIITVVGCGGDRDKSKRPIMAKIGYDMSDVLILTSDNPRTEKPESIIDDMKKGIEGLYFENKVYILVDRYDAIEKACRLAKSGDFVLIAGKGHENYQEVNGVQTHFDDMEELQKNLT
jgi:UDP-N-acetylmuramoyl-L-alanyl-D-glutamate--2,6-diaminopimelate ligase